MANSYCMFKGKLQCAAPYFHEYEGDPHYVITVSGADATPFNIVVNSASKIAVNGDDHRVYSYLDLNFTDPIAEKISILALGLYKTGFPRLDYFQDRSLLDLRRMRVIPYEDVDGSRFDINDEIDEILTIDESQPFEMMPYRNGERKFWKPNSASDVIVYGFGFLFQPKEDGLHETHMNQGNPENSPFARSNGIFQDGAVIVQKGSNFAAIFTAFQSQLLPTKSNGYPAKDAVPLPEFIARG